jgi:predicted metal-binding membrane protein
MTTAALPRASRGLAALVALLLGLAAVAWVLTYQRMEGMDAGPATELGDVGWFAVSWTLMMAAMMLPSLTPMVAAYRRRGTAGGSAVFAGGYLAAWVAAGLVAYAAFDAVRSLDLGFLAWDEAGRYVAAATILGAGIYQLTSPKAGCLRRCRERDEFVADQWHPGPLGALRMGLAHGAFCVGCCWALMAALFALGVMSLTWMALVAALIAAERLLPRPAHVGVAVVLVALGAAVALAPGDLPGLTVPNSSPEMAPSMEMSPSMEMN